MESSDLPLMHLQAVSLRRDSPISHYKTPNNRRLLTNFKPASGAHQDSIGSLGNDLFFLAPTCTERIFQ